MFTFETRLNLIAGMVFGPVSKFSGRHNFLVYFDVYSNNYGPVFLCSQGVLKQLVSVAVSSFDKAYWLWYIKILSCFLKCVHPSHEWFEVNSFYKGCLCFVDVNSSHLFVRVGCGCITEL